jgi:hypothetical protein
MQCFQIIPGPVVTIWIGFLLNAPEGKKPLKDLGVDGRKLFK